MTEQQENSYYISGLSVPKTPESGQRPEPWGKTSVIGTKRPRIDGYERVTGTAVYPSDVALPNRLFGAILRCPHPHALVKKVNINKAAKQKGVHAVIFSETKEADVNWYYSREHVSKLFDTHCRFEGEAVAAVAAETPYQAWDALRAIEVEYEVLPFITDEQSALKANAPHVHDGGNIAGEDSYERGDVSRGFGEADVVLEENYRTECELHTPMELHGCVANWDGGRLNIWESTQGVYRVQSMVASSLGIPLSRVRVIGHYMGGGFGSKLQAGKYTVIAAILAKMTARPIKMFLTREETYLVAGNRPASTMRLKAGIKKDGTLTALEFDCLGTSGAYPGGGTSLVDWLVKDLYTCPNVKTKSIDVFTHAGLVRPFRAPGHPQGAWALEQMMDALAKAIDMDPVELRLKNIPTVSQAREGNPPYTTTGLKECLETGARVFDWKNSRSGKTDEKDQGNIRRGVGMASCLWVVGGGRPPSSIVLKLFSDGSANLNMGASDIGTGTKTVMAMIVSEELGLKPEFIQIENADTGTTQYATPSGGSKTIPTESPAVRAAAIEVKRQLLDMAASQLETDVTHLTIKGDEILAENDREKKIKITALAEFRERGVIIGVGYRGPNPENKVVNPFAAQFCEVEVNMKTGEIKIKRFVAAHDSGRVMNRLTYDNQVCGGITMGIGLATTEIRLLDNNNTGKLVNRNWHDYKLPTAMDVPFDILSVPVETNDAEANTTGAKGLGEPVTIPTAAAIANAVYNATGVRVTKSPINPTTLCQYLTELS